MTVKIVNQSKHELPEYKTSGSAGMDLRANLENPVELKPLQRALIPTGIFIALPDGTEAQIRPRSGLAAKKGITVANAPGTIDSDYRGEIKVILVNLSDETNIINDGDRVAQMIIADYRQIKWDKTNALNETIRGEGGFGHTGVH
jgi:dUTP diphosphatase